MSSVFTRFAATLTLLLSVVLSAGCHSTGSSGDGASKEEAWLVAFKKTLAKTEMRFYQARYIQKKDDPFYLKEITPGLVPGKPLTPAQQEAIEIRYDDYTESWPLLTSQLERTQLIFSATSVVPSFRAMLVLASFMPAGSDAEGAADLLKFKDLVLKGTIFDPRTKMIELSPETRSDVVELANKIASHTLEMIKTNLSQASGAQRVELMGLANRIRLLNVRAAEIAGQPVSKSGAAGITDPLKAWSELKVVYDDIFTALGSPEKIGELQERIAHTRSKARARKLRRLLGDIVASSSVQLSRIPVLQKREAELLSDVISATEKQFKLASDLVNQ